MHDDHKDWSHSGTELLGLLTHKIYRLQRTVRQAHKWARPIRRMTIKIRQRIKDLTAELYHKPALWLWHNSSVVLHPNSASRRS